MSYTQSDLDSIDDAILAYALGTRTGSTLIAGHKVVFADISLSDLQNTRAIIAADVANTAGTFSPRTYAQNGGRD